MNTVWIVFSDSGPGTNILGVFGDEEEALAYAQSVDAEYPDGALTSEFPVPWRASDNTVAISST